jgi:DNA-binding Lrp family transcriptional regulator
MVVIHYPTAFRALNEFVDHFNSKAEKATARLRSGAVMTAKEIIRIYGVALLKAAGISQLDLANIPSLQTNNKQLAKLVKCSPRTIQRHITKLLDSGIITEKKFHGSNSNFELWLNPKILLIKSKKPVDKLKKELHQSLQEAKQRESESAFSDFETTKCPHTYSSYTSNKKNNVLKEVETVDKARSLHPLTTENDSSYNAGDRTRYTGEIAESNTEKQDKILKKFCGENFSKETEKGNEEAGEIASRADQSEHLNVRSDPARDNSLNLHVNLLWLMVRNLLYKNTDLTENQVEIAKKQIRKLYEPSTEDNISRYHQNYVERVSLVHKFLQKDARRFVPLPYIYFNFNNPFGFTSTKAWHKQYLVRRKEVECDLALSRAIRKYTNNEKQPPHARRPTLQLFRECENTLGKLGGTTLSDRFCSAVIEHETYGRIRTNKPTKN